MLIRTPDEAAFLVDCGICSNSRTERRNAPFFTMAVAVCSALNFVLGQAGTAKSCLESLLYLSRHAQLSICCCIHGILNAVATDSYYCYLFIVQFFVLYGELICQENKPFNSIYIIGLLCSTVNWLQAIEQLGYIFYY